MPSERGRNLGRNQFAVLFDDPFQICENSLADLHLFGLAAEAKFIAANDDMNSQAFSNLAQILVLTAEHNPDLFLTLKCGTF